MRKDEQTQTNPPPDPAAIFACALSLRDACMAPPRRGSQLNLSDCYSGLDGFFRESMRVAELFECWACEHVHFDDLMEVWPYLLEDKFGEACLSAIGADELEHFDETDCLRVGLRLRLPIKLDGKLPLPFGVTVSHPSNEAGFVSLRIQTVRDSVDGTFTEPFTFCDDPFDEELGKPYFALYGSCEGGELEHIADRDTYAEIEALARNLVPGNSFPSELVAASF